MGVPKRAATEIPYGLSSHVISVGGQTSHLKAPSGRGLPTTSGGGECVNGISVGATDTHRFRRGAPMWASQNVHLQGSRADCYLPTPQLFQFSLQRKLTKKSPSGGLRPPKGALPPHGDKDFPWQSSTQPLRQSIVL